MSKTGHATVLYVPQKNDSKIDYPPPLDAFPLAVAPFERTSVYVSPSVHFYPFCNIREYLSNDSRSAKIRILHGFYHISR